MKKLEKNWKLLTKITQICTWNLGWPMEKNIPDKHQRHQQLEGEFSTQKAEPSLFQNWSHWKHRCQRISLDWYLFSTLRNHARHVFCRFFFQFPGATSKSVQSHRIPVTPSHTQLVRLLKMMFPAGHSALKGPPTWPGTVLLVIL